MYLSACGFNCEECPYKDQCKGICHAIKGAPFYINEFGVDTCPIFDCAVNKKGYTTCAPCAELPCQLHFDWKDPDMTNDEHVRSIAERVKILKASVSKA